MKIIIVTLGLSALSVVVPSATPKQFISDKAMSFHFLAHRVDFEKLVAMANEDNHLIRIAPDFTWLDDDSSWPRKDVGISVLRWNDYRQLFRSLGATDGVIKRDSPTRIIFPIASIGLVPAGSEKGLVYSQAPLSPVLKSLDKRPPGELWDGPDRSHVLAYKPIDDYWYIYYEQW